MIREFNQFKVNLALNKLWLPFAFILSVAIAIPSLFIRKMMLLFPSSSGR